MITRGADFEESAPFSFWEYMTTDDEIRKASQAVQDGLEVLFRAMWDSSKLASEEFGKIAKKLMALCDAARRKAN